MRAALSDAPQVQAVRVERQQIFQAFMQQVLPSAGEPTRLLAADLISKTWSAVGKAFSATPRTEAEISIYADAMADMFCAYIGQLAEAH